MALGVGITTCTIWRSVCEWLRRAWPVIGRARRKVVRASICRGLGVEAAG